MNLRTLGMILIFLGVVGGLIGFYQYEPKELENQVLKYAEDHEGRDLEMMKLQQAIWSQERLEGRTQSLSQIPPLDTSMRDRWKIIKAQRERNRLWGFVAGGGLFLIGLLCVASHKSISPQSAQ